MAPALAISVEGKGECVWGEVQTWTYGPHDHSISVARIQPRARSLNGRAGRGAREVVSVPVQEENRIEGLPPATHLVILSTC